VEEQLYRKFYEIETTHWWFSARQKIVLDIIQNRLALPHDAKVLDVGCGTGAILAEFARQYEAYGTDTSPLAIEYCHKRGIANAFHCTLKTFPLSDLRFDLITLLDVVEHVDEDVGILKQAYQLIKPNGHILVAVPAYEFLWSQYDDLNHHKRRYTKSHLMHVLRESGFTVEMCSYYNTILFPTALVKRLSERFIKGKEDTTLDFPAPLINSTLKSVFGFERFLLRRFSLPFGLSLIALAKKDP
jgi:2-polyprenyl-3-methyl-5-hydroxy-6-metoxy-1,4-benzoquinol methylase